jgi:hypothetical protein
MRTFHLLMVLGLALQLPQTLSGRNNPASAGPPAGSAPAAFAWQTAARLRHALGSTRGTLHIGEHAIEFQGAKGAAQRWPYVEIESLDLGLRRLELTSYENRGWHRPGDRRYRFDLDAPMPGGVAAELARRVGKPVRNRIPLAQAAGFARLPARHRTRTGGSNGALRFTAQGIDYLTSKPGDSRAWRWRDLQTVSNPDAYHLTVFAYRDTFSFELKEPMPSELFDRLSAKILQQNPLAENPGERP